MEALLTVMALLFLLFVVLGAYATVKVVRAAKRGVDRTITQARRTVEDHTLRAKSFAQPGPVGELAQLRLRLRTSMRATQDALQEAVAEDPSLEEAAALFQRLSAHGHDLDDEMRRLETEPDRGAVAQRLPALRERTEQITRNADALRWAARDRARRFAEEDLEALSAQIDLEAGALRHWTSTDPGPSASSAGPAGQGASAGGGTATPPPPPWPETPPAHDTEAARQTWPETPHARPGEEAARQAITPPQQRPTYPWQKKPRPESTT